MSHGKVVRIVNAYGIELMPLKSTSANRGIGIIIPSSECFLEIISGRRVRSTDRAPRPLAAGGPARTEAPLSNR